MIKMLMLRYFSPRIRNALSGVSDFKKYNEIRLRRDAPVILRGVFRDELITTCICNQDDIEYSFRAVCDDSIHSYARELKEGFITIPGGHRVGLCGTAVNNDKGLKTIKNISGMNFRIARQITGCSDHIYKQLFSQKPCSVLISGAPLSGKTTILRDLCRNLARDYRVSVIDERSEIAAVYNGEPQNDVGSKSDIFDGYSKRSGIETAIRVMSPEVIVCDEIGSCDDVKALYASMNSGVKIVASVHAGSPEELLTRKRIMKLVKSGMFEYIVFLEYGGRTSSVVHWKELLKKSVV